MPITPISISIRVSLLLYLVEMALSSDSSSESRILTEVGPMTSSVTLVGASGGPGNQIMDSNRRNPTSYARHLK